MTASSVHLSQTHARLVPRTLHDSAHISAPPPALWGILLVVLGAGLFVFGTAGWRHGDKLLPSWIPDHLYQRRSVVLRRGAATFVIVGAVLLVLGVLTLVGN